VRVVGDRNQFGTWVGVGGRDHQFGARLGVGGRDHQFGAWVAVGGNAMSAVANQARDPSASSGIFRV